MQNLATHGLLVDVHTLLISNLYVQTNQYINYSLRLANIKNTRNLFTLIIMCVNIARVGRILLYQTVTEARTCIIIIVRF